MLMWIRNMSGYQSWVYNFLQANPSPILLAFVTFMLSILREIYLKSVVRMKHKFLVISECNIHFCRFGGVRTVFQFSNVTRP